MKSNLNSDQSAGFLKLYRLPLGRRKCSPAHCYQCKQILVIFILFVLLLRTVKRGHNVEQGTVRVVTTEGKQQNERVFIPCG